MNTALAAPDWLWIPVTIFAAFAQTIRNAAQKHLTAELGTMGATLVRFLYALPFSYLMLAAVVWLGFGAIPPTSLKFWLWTVASALAQMAATALLLRVMEERNFALGVAYAKTELIQVAVFGLIFLGDPITGAMLVAVLIGTAGVLMLSPADPQRPFRALLSGWTSRTALLGIASGAGFGIAAVGYRGGALSLEGSHFLMQAAVTLVAAQTVQTLLLGGWLQWRDARAVKGVLRAWRPSLAVGLSGAAASAGWFTATAIETAGNVRTLGLIDLLFTYVISRRIFRERLSRRETCGLLLLASGLLVVTLGR